MRTIPVDGTRVRLMATGVVQAVDEWVEVGTGSDAQRRRSGNQQRDETTRLPLWRVEALIPPEAGDERAQTEKVWVEVPSKDMPEVGGWGVLLYCTDLDLRCWVGRDGKLGQALRASAVKASS